VRPIFDRTAGATGNPSGFWLSAGLVGWLPRLQNSKEFCKRDLAEATPNNISIFDGDLLGVNLGPSPHIP